MMRPVVAKVGGSLFDLPDLRERLLTWAEGLKGRPIVFVPGGGQAADVIRTLDRCHNLGEGPAHWLALRMMAVNAHFLARLVEASVVTTGTCTAGAEVARPGRSVLDAHAFCEADAATSGAIEHSWLVTSDSVAARVAATLGADLYLLKSRDLPPGWSWTEAAAAGLVDPAFARYVGRDRVPVTWVNLRQPDSNRRQ